MFLIKTNRLSIFKQILELDAEDPVLDGSPKFLRDFHKDLESFLFSSGLLVKLLDFTE
jgi:hypothetical protein